MEMERRLIVTIVCMPSTPLLKTVEMSTVIETQNEMPVLPLAIPEGPWMIKITIVEF